MGEVIKMKTKKQIENKLEELIQEQSALGNRKSHHIPPRKQGKMRALAWVLETMTGDI